MTAVGRAATARRVGVLVVVIGVCLSEVSPSAAVGFDLPSGATVDVFDSMSLVLPTSTARGANTVKLTAAKNEYESFQVKVAAGASPIDAMSVSLGTSLTGPKGASIPAGNVRFYREDYYKLTTMSDGEMKAEFPRDAAGTCSGDCRIPDALIPERDQLVNEDRAAFPTVVPANENRVAWIDVLIPATATAGTYTGSILVKSGATTLVMIPLSVEVLNVAIPSTSTMQSQVFVHTNDVGGWSTYQQLAELGLNDRISLVPDGFSPATGAGVLGPLLNGTDPKVPLAGARLTTIPITHFANAADWRSALTSLGRADAGRFWCDEATTADCSGWYTTALASYPGLKLQQIPQYLKPTTDPGYLESRTQTAVPIVTDLDGKVTWFQQWKAASAGREFWAYTSCMSGGCNAAYLDNALYNGRPSFGIDQPNSEARAMGWQGFRVGISGEHYWNATGSYSQAWNLCSGTQPTNCQYTAAGEATGMNGDGNLFYKWNQAKIGGTTPIPAESLRLKRFRDGREDNEIMNLLAANGRQADTMAVANGLFPSFVDNNRTPAQVASARAQLETLVRQVFPASPASAVSAQDLNCDGTDDMLAVGSDGQLLFFARTNGNWAPDAPKGVATGWLNKYRELLLPGDVNGDGKPDLLGRTAMNSLEVWTGACNGTFTKGAALPPLVNILSSPSAMALSDMTTPGDFDGDGKVDLLDQRPDGTMWLASGTGTGFGVPRQIGQAWTTFTVVAVGDATGDGKSDLIGRRNDGRVFLYRGNGAGGLVTAKGEDTGVALNPIAVPYLLGAGDMNGDGKVDLAAIAKTGELSAYLGNGAGGFSATPTRMGAGWTTSVVQVGD
ncbi:FG-GAP-like repeat-containing protein [Mycobacterium sp. shizuoka-1]|uniref:FG-GAP-like repeat-containing protein n=1 Tax=Mycobacterium sp. shizuoka-1 TaxID=2039281 RepID=UPI00130479B1|nr:FG-GAP-like repeat-containing protein [Mycobacterium sp. shizuoka-1]